MYIYTYIYIYVYTLLTVPNKVEPEYVAERDQVAKHEHSSAARLSKCAHAHAPNVMDVVMVNVMNGGCHESNCFTSWHISS